MAVSVSKYRENQIHNVIKIFVLNKCRSISNKLPFGFLLLPCLFLTSCFLTSCDQKPAEVLVINSPELETPILDPIELEFDSLGDRSANLNGNHPRSISLPISCRNDSIVSAYINHQSSLQVKGCGKVTAVLSDDTEGSRHQRFIVQLDNTEPKHTLLIAHNIDLAPRVSGLKKGDNIVFYGEYEYNAQGGVVHWTHHDPASRHQHGWIERNNKRFQ